MKGFTVQKPALRLGFSPYDAALAVMAPIAALWLRNAMILEPSSTGLAFLYCFISTLLSLTVFASFGIHRSIPGFFTVRDVLNIAKAVLIGEVLTSAILFSIMRLDGIPRSVPAIHALILGAGLFSIRLIAHIGASRDTLRESHGNDVATVLIGVNKLSALYMKLVDAVDHRRERIVALLDEHPHSIGRTVNGVRVFGQAADLQRLVLDFELHGIDIQRVVLSGNDSLSPEARTEVERVCGARGIEIAFIPKLLGIEQSTPSNAPRATSVAPTPAIALPAYFRYKRALSIVIAVLLGFMLAPLCALVAAVTFIDVGAPLFFWQQRVGQNGRSFLLYKFRTFKEPFDWRGRRIPDEQRLSKLGKLIRKFRFDEAPQLLNVIVGDMAFIGPRPLLPQDQPASASIRLLVRPGITGWAQVNGGALLSSAEKGLLDEWYIRHATLWIDIRILLMTVRSFLYGDRRSEIALQRALVECTQEQAAERAQREANAASTPRIAFINRFFYPDQSATSQMVSDLAFDLAGHGYDIHVFTSRQRYGDALAALPEIERIRGVTVHRVKTTAFGRAAALGRLFDYFSFYWAVWQSIRGWARPDDVLVAKTDPPLLGVLGRALARRKGLRLINWLQDLYPEVAARLGVRMADGVIGRALLRLRDASLRFADANVVIGQQMADHLRARGIPVERTRVIPNWCDDEDVFPIRHEENPLRRTWRLDGKFVVEYSGNLGRGHEYETLLDAAEHLRDETRIVFLFIGGGSGFEQLRRTAARRGLNDRFLFQPYQERGHLRHSLSAGDVHLVSLKPELEGLMVPSKFYGIAAAGRPMIAICAKSGEIGTLVEENDCGVVIEPGRGAVLAETLKALMQSPDRLEAMGRNARSLIEDQFSQRQALALWNSVIEAVAMKDRVPTSAPVQSASDIKILSAI